jgi:hypothetical protein
MSTSDELYALALQYRDNKVAGCFAEDSLVEAEKRFLELGQQGHSKAMHNYAVLQQKQGRYKLAMEWFTRAGLDASKRNIIAMKKCGQIKEDLYLVVANDRKTGITYGPIMGAVYGNEMDISHLHSFGGNATTCDINPSAIPGAKHIKVDVLTFDFAKKHNLKHVLIERLPTINSIKPTLRLGDGPGIIDAHSSGSFEADAKINYLGSVVENLSLAMEPGAVLEIEWDPFSTQLQLPPEKLEGYHAANPFHGFMSMDATTLGAQCINPDRGASWIPEKRRDIAREYGEKFRAEVEFWHSQGAGTSVDELVDRMNAEVEVFVRLMNSAICDKKPLLAFVESDVLTGPTEKVVAALKNAKFESFRPHLAGKPVQMADGRRGVFHDAGSLVADSIFGMAINSLCVQHNMPYAKRYLESIGFKEVQIERRTNTHNGKKNVWMVKAVKA